MLCNKPLSLSFLAPAERVKIFSCFLRACSSVLEAHVTECVPTFWACCVLAAGVREEGEALGAGAEARASQDRAAGLGHHVAAEQGAHNVARGVAALAGACLVREDPGGQACPAEMVGAGAAGTAGEGARLPCTLQRASEDAGADWTLKGAKKEMKDKDMHTETHKKACMHTCVHVYLCVFVLESYVCLGVTRFGTGEARSAGSRVDLVTLRKI